MNATTIFTALACVTFSASAFALIGEDEKQIQARYGPPQQTFPVQGRFRDVGYAAYGFMLVLTFDNGVSKREGFARPDKSALSSDAIQRILALKERNGRNCRRKMAPVSGVALTAKRWQFSQSRGTSSSCRIQILNNPMSPDQAVPRTAGSR